MTTQNFMAVTYGYKEIYGFEGGDVARIAKEISSYNLYSILETLCKISIRLFSHGQGNKDTQIHLVKDVFNDDLVLRKKIRFIIEKGFREKNISKWAIFTEQPLMLLVKIALGYAQKTEGKEVKAEDLKQIGTWLLILTDVCGKSPLDTPIALPLETQREELRKAVARGYFVTAEERLLYRVARFHQIFFYLRKLHPEFDIDKRFAEATNGIILDKYISFCFYITAHWISLTAREIDIAHDWVIGIKQYFKETKLTETDVTESLKLLTLNVANYEKDYKNAVDTILKGNDIYPFNFLPMQKHPLIVHDDCIVCPSPKFLLNKATDGIYWILENDLREKKSKDWSTLPTVWGDAFEEYMHNRLQNGLGSDYRKKIIFNDQEKFDGFINGAETVFPIEMKYAHWSLKAKTTGKKEDMMPTLNQLFSKKKGLGQIMRSLKELEKKIWSLPENMSGKKVVPILVVGEAMPMDAYNRRLYEEIALVNGVFYENSNILPFIVLSAEEIEILEAIAVKDGNAAAEKLLVDYASLFKNRLPNGGYVREAMEFKNYLVSIGYPTETNKSLTKIYGDLIDAAAMGAFGKKLVHKPRA